MPIIPCFIFNFPFVIFYAFKDIFLYIKHKKWKNFNKYGIKVFKGMFGHGKTLSSSHYAHKFYKKWGNDLLFLANYELKNMPFTKLISFEQLVQIQETWQKIEIVKRRKGKIDDYLKKYDKRLKKGKKLLIVEKKHRFKLMKELCDINKKLPIMQRKFPYKGVVVCIQEIELLLNNRKYADFPIELLHTLCQPRKFKMYFMVDAQEFSMIDIAFRRISSWVDDCFKLWRFQNLKTYSAWDVENAINPHLVKPISKRCFFIHDKDYDSYDTLESVTRLNSADFISNKESLERKGYTLSDLNVVENKSRKGKKVSSK